MFVYFPFYNAQYSVFNNIEYYPWAGGLMRAFSNRFRVRLILLKQTVQVDGVLFQNVCVVGGGLSRMQGFGLLYLLVSGAEKR